MAALPACWLRPVAFYDGDAGCAGSGFPGPGNPYIFGGVLDRLSNRGNPVPWAERLERLHSRAVRGRLLRFRHMPDLGIRPSAAIQHSVPLLVWRRILPAR